MKHNILKYSLFILVGLLFIPAVVAQEAYRTEVFQPKRIKSLQVKQPDEIFTVPIITLNSGEQIEIKFDDLTPHFTRYAYSIIHCDADWTPSRLSQVEYMQGFQGLTIDDYGSSFNTTTLYVNYKLLLPNDDIQLKVSGNYVVRVYQEDDPASTVLTACFSVVDPQIGLFGEVLGNTLIDTYRSHQQVNFTINKKNFPIAFPQRDLKIRVVQNNRPDKRVADIQPTSILSDRIVYENVRNLIFTAGNEYRRMEFLTHRYNGIRVEKTDFFNPYYHATLMTDKPTAMATYEYDQDQNGRFYPACSRCNDVDTEADYFIVHFALQMPQAKNGEVYLNGDFVQNLFKEENRMVYNAESGCYEKAMLLKQGNYNYQYLFVREGATQGETGSIEGDFHETENEYLIYVYYCPAGARYDQLIGTQTLHANQLRL